MAQGRVLVRQSMASDLLNRKAGAGLLKADANLPENVGLAEKWMNNLLHKRLNKK